MPPGTLSSSTRMVMAMANTPSTRVSMRSLGRWNVAILGGPIIHAPGCYYGIHACRFIDVTTAPLLRLLGDETRLRLLRLLSRESLNVSELTAVLGVAQSGVSRHLRLLRDAHLVTEEKAGGFSWYRLSDQLTGADGALGSLHVWLDGEFQHQTAETRADDSRLAEVLRLRKDSFAVHGDERRQLVPGRSWPAWSRALGLLLPAVDVAD